MKMKPFEVGGVTYFVTEDKIKDAGGSIKKAVELIITENKEPKKKTSKKDSEPIEE